MSSAPTPKMAATGITGAVAILVIYIAGLFGLEVPAEAAAAFVAVLSFAAGYFKRDASTDAKHVARGGVSLD